jgi:hypothetical protein
MNFNLKKVLHIFYQVAVCFDIRKKIFFLNEINLVSIGTYFIGKRHLSHRITKKPTQVTAAAVASGGPLSVPLNDSNNIPNQSETSVSEFHRI